MNSKESQKFKKILLTKKYQIEDTLKKIDENNPKDQHDSSSELSSYDNHPADTGSELFQAELNKGLKVHQENLLRETIRALDKIENRTYGICEACGKEITTPRLEVVPYALYCIDCEEKQSTDSNEIRKASNQRPIEELSLDASFGKGAEDGTYQYDRFSHLYDMFMIYGSSDTPQDLDGEYNYKQSSDYDE